MPDRSINFGVIGLGRIGKLHIDNLLYRLPRANLIAVASAELDIPWLKSRQIKNYFQSVEELIQHPDIDAIIIAVPTAWHVGMIEKIATANKHIFCEKPISCNPQEIKNIKKLVEPATIKIQVGYNRRFDREYLAVKQQVDNGNIGDIHILKITNRDPKRPLTEFATSSGGLFMDFNVHDFDMARFICNDEIKTVFATGSKLILPPQAKSYEVDTAVILLQMEKGAFCIIDSSVETHYGYDQQLEVFGSLGMVHADNVRPTTLQYLSEQQKTQFDSPFYSFVERYQQAYIDELNAFIDCIINDTEPAIGLDDAVKAVEIACLAQRSLQGKKLMHYDEIRAWE